MKDSNGSEVIQTAEMSEAQTTRHLTKLKTDALFAYLNAIQDINKRLREMNIDEEIRHIMQSFDKSCAEAFLRERK